MTQCKANVSSTVEKSDTAKNSHAFGDVLVSLLRLQGLAIDMSRWGIVRCPNKASV